MKQDLNVVIVGGGLAGCLLALRLLEEKPNIKMCIVEAGTSLGGNHTWSFFETDLSPKQQRFLEPLIEYRWPGYEVHFPERTHHLSTGYRSITSARLHAVLMERLGQSVLLGTRVVSLSHDNVDLGGDSKIHAPCVIDARGARELPGSLSLSRNSWVKKCG